MFLLISSFLLIKVRHVHTCKECVLLSMNITLTLLFVCPELVLSLFLIYLCYGSFVLSNSLLVKASSLQGLVVHHFAPLHFKEPYFFT